MNLFFQTNEGDSRRPENKANRVKTPKVLATLDGDCKDLTMVPLYNGRVALQDGGDFYVIELGGDKTRLPGIVDVRPLSSDGKLVWLNSEGSLVMGQFEEASRSLLAESVMSLQGLYSQVSVAAAIAGTEMFRNLAAMFRRIMENPEVLLENGLFSNQKMIPEMVTLARTIKESLSGTPRFLSTSSDGGRVALVISNNIMQFEVTRAGQLCFVGSTPVTGEIMSIKARQNDAIAVIREENGQLVIRSTAQTSDLLKLERLLQSEHFYVDKIAFSGDGNRMALVTADILGNSEAALYIIPQGLEADTCHKATELWNEELRCDSILSMGLNNDGTGLVLCTIRPNQLKTVEFCPSGQEPSNRSVADLLINTMAYSPDGSLFVARLETDSNDQEHTMIISITEQQR
jgi:hypothetical protein